MRILLALALVVSIATPGERALPSVLVAAACASSTGPGIPPPASVPRGIPGYHAAWYGQSGYMRLCPGARATAIVAYYNAGSLGWYQGVMGRAAYLGTWAGEPGQDQPSVLGGDGQRGSPPTGWPRYDRAAAQPHAYVGPGQVAWFQFTVQAPATPGTYRLGIRPLVEGATWMEDAGVFWEVTVLNPDGSAPVPAPGPRAGLYVEVTGAVAASDIHEVHAGVERAGGYLASAAGGDRSRRAVARITTGDGTERFCCITQGPTFDIVTGNVAWSAPSAASADTWSASTERTELAAHEYVHLWQYEVGGGACMVGPRWISEGMAESLAYRSLTAAGLIPQANLDTFTRRQLTNARYVTLRSLESSWPSDANPFAVAYLAVDRLLAASGPLPLRAWCERVGAGQDWRTAFAGAFGETPDAFYARFEAFRAQYLR